MPPLFQSYQIMARIIGILITGAAVRLFSICIAVYVGHLGSSILIETLDKVSAALP